MQRLTTILIVVTCILHVNTFMLQDTSNNESNDGSQQTQQQKTREIIKLFNKPAENNELGNIFSSLMKTGMKSFVEHPNPMYFYLAKYGPQHKMNAYKKAHEMSNSYKPPENPDVQNIVLALSAGIKTLLEHPNKIDYYLDKYGQQILTMLKEKVKPIVKSFDNKYFRTKPEQAQLNVEKQFQHYFKIADKYLEELFSSEPVQKNIDHVVKKASVIYHAFKEQANKENNNL